MNTFLRDIQAINIYLYFKKIILKPENFQLVAVLICALIFISGVAFGICNPTPSLVGISKSFSSLVIPFFSTGLFLIFITYHVKERIDKAERKYKRKEIELIRKSVDPYRVCQDLEFLSIVYEGVFEGGSDKFLNGFDYRCFSPHVIELLDTSGLKEETQKYNAELRYRKKAVAGLEKGFKFYEIDDANYEADKNSYPFVSLIIQACNNALDIPNPDISNCTGYEWVEGFYLDIKMYLKAWLICSLRYGVAIPVEPFHRNYLEGKGIGKYKGIETYVKAITYIQFIALTDKAILPYFGDAEVREIVQEYLGKLIDLLQYQDVPLRHSIPH